MSDLKPQRRGRRIAMPPDALNEYLTRQPTCRVATVDATGAPHVAPLWFAWHEDTLWLYSLSRSQRWTDLQRDPRIAVVIDDGDSYGELRGVEIRGSAEAVGPVPRTADADVPELADLETVFAQKYHEGASQMTHDGRHAWLRVTPEKIVSWDFTRIPQ